ncbi:MAG: N-methyl-L-tryptophan oxidase [Pseudomonadota bacterium]
MTTASTYDVAVVGMGAMGAATVAALSKRGLRVLGIDQFAPPHDQGSSHGETRLLRTAYAENPEYVPLVNRAIELWREFEDLTGQILFEQTGVVYAAHEPSCLLDGIRLAAEEHCLPTQTIQLSERREVLPQLSVPDDWTMMFEPDGGFVHAERSIQVMLDIAARREVTLVQNEAVLSVSTDGSGHRIATRENLYHADRVIISAGAWVRNLLPELSEHLHLQRRVLHWFKSAPDSFTQSNNFKPFCIADNGRWIYGFPDVTGGRIKVADHHESEYLDDIETINRDTTKQDFSALTSIISNAFPTLGPLISSKVCVYTMSSDEHFILGECPNRKGVFVATGFSGHGFKFASAIGELMADMATDSSYQMPYELLSIDRYMS